MAKKRTSTMQLDEEAIIKVRERIIECGDCWDWQGSFNQSGVPMFYAAGQKTTVRRAMLDRQFLSTLAPLDVLTVNCGNPKCVCPAHIEILSRGKFLKRNNLRTNHQLRLAKIAEVHRSGPGAKLNWDLVAEILQSDETNIALAARMGCDHTLISLVRHGKAWKQYGANPFAGLQPSQKVAARGRA